MFRPRSAGSLPSTQPASESAQETGQTAFVGPITRGLSNCAPSMDCRTEIHVGHQVEERRVGHPLLERAAIRLNASEGEPIPLDVEAHRDLAGVSQALADSRALDQFKSTILEDPIVRVAVLRRRTVVERGEIRQHGVTDGEPVIDALLEYLVVQEDLDVVDVVAERLHRGNPFLAAECVRRPISLQPGVQRFDVDACTNVRLPQHPERKSNGHRRENRGRAAPTNSTHDQPDRAFLRKLPGT